MTSVMNPVAISPFAPASPVLNDTQQNTTKTVSAADSIHDFCGLSQKKENANNELKDNKLFAKCLKNVFGTHLERVGITISPDYKINNASTIENSVLTFLHINDEKKIDYSKFEQDYNENIIMANMRNKPFYFIVDDLTDTVFKRTFGALCSVAYNNTGSKIKFITDTNILGDSVVCSIEVNKNNPKKGMLVVSEASYYDSGTLKKVDDVCVMQKLIPVELSKTNGNLFGLNKISLKTDEAQNQISKDNLALDKMKIVYTYKIKDNTRASTSVEADTTRGPQNTELVMQTFIESQKKKNSGSENRNKNLFKNVINMLVEPEVELSAKRQKRGGGEKRKRVTTSGVIEAIYKIYNLDYSDFNTGIDGIFQFISILLDFKRAGDQLQIKSARKNNSVFISNDKISAAYAHFCGIPCIKTSPIGKKIGNAHRARKLVFYGFKTENITATLLNRRVMYKDSLLYHSAAIEYFLPQFSSFHDKLRIVLEQTTANRFSYPYIKYKLQLIIDKSYEMLKITTELDRRTCDRFDVECRIDKSRRFEYIYLLEYNIIVCNFLIYLVSTKFSDLNLSDITRFRQHIESLTEIDNATLNNMIEIVKSYDNDYRVTFLHYFKLDDNTINFFLNVLRIYMSSDANILFQEFNISRFDEYFANFTTQIRKTIIESQKMPNIPIISEYMNCINAFPRRSHYNLYFIFPNNNNIKVEKCIFIDLKRATGKWLSIHNKIVEIFDDSFQFLNKLIFYSMKDREFNFESFSVQERITGGQSMSRRRSSSISAVAKLLSRSESLKNAEDLLSRSDKLLSVNPKKLNGVSLKTVAKLLSASNAEQKSRPATKIRVAKENAKSILDSIDEKINNDTMTPYELFLEQMNDEYFENLDIDFSKITEEELNEIYHTDNLYTNQNLFTQDFYKIIIMFLVKTLKVFDDHGNLSEKYQDDTPMSQTYSMSRSRSIRRTPSTSRSRTSSSTTVQNRNINKRQGIMPHLSPIIESDDDIHE